MCGEPPWLVLPKFRLPGLARASASSSASVRAGRSLLTSSTFGVPATSVTGEKSRAGS